MATIIATACFDPRLFILAGSGKSRTDLLGHLHGRLQICRLLGKYPSLNIPLQAIDETEEGFHIINITILHVSLTETLNIVSYVASLHPFCQRLMHFE